MEDLFDDAQPLKGAELLYEFAAPKVRFIWGIENGLAYPFLSRPGFQSWVDASPLTRRRAANVSSDTVLIMRVREALEKNIIPAHLL